MYELIPAGEKTWVIQCPAKIGIYEGGDGVTLIDSGNDKEAAKKAQRILEAKNWTLKRIINTHSNADHIGGNATLQQRTGCEVWGTGLENAFTQFPHLEPSFLYGGYPVKELRNKFLQALPSHPDGDVDDGVFPGLSIFHLPGHFFDMIGVHTDDDVCFIADSVFSEQVLQKYHVNFIYDVQAYLDTLEMLRGIQARLFVPAHAEITDDLGPLLDANRNKVLQIRNLLLDICRPGLIFEDILHRVFQHYGLTMDFNQYVLVGSTIRSYLAWLHNAGSIACEFEQNYLRWITV